MYNVQDHVDSYERETLGSYSNLRIPLHLEYIPKGKWKPYVKAGFVLDVEVYGRSTDVYANTNNSAPVNSWVHSPSVRGDEMFLSTLLSGGIKYRHKEIDLLFGLTSQIGLFSFYNQVEVNRLALGVEFGIRKGISNGIMPNRGQKRNDSISKEKARYVYVEGIGSGGLVSLNFERCLARKDTSDTIKY